MMIVSIISLVVSCIIQGLLSNYLGYTYADLSLFSTIYILITILVIRPFFENEKKYLLLLIIFGFLMGIAYTDAVFLNVCLFLVIYYFSKVFHFIFPYNFLTINISSLLGVFIYHIVTFLFLFVLKYDAYSVGMLVKVLTHSILMTLIYTSFLYIVFSFIFKKLELREIK